MFEAGRAPGYTCGMNIKKCLLTLTIAVSFSTALAANAQYFGSERVFRGVQTSRYQVEVQKSAGIDIRLSNGMVAVEDGWAAVKLAGENKLRRLRLDGRKSTRDTVANALGEGKSLLLGGKGFLYAINAYETQPFLTLRLAYQNDTKNPVQIESLTVLAGNAGKESGLMFGPAAQQTRLLTTAGPGICDRARVWTGEAQGFGSIAAWESTEGHVLVAGFLGAPLTSGRLLVSFPPTPAETGGKRYGGNFSFDWVPDKPVTLEPGARLELPPLYLSVAGQDPVEEMRRFGRAFELSMDPAALPATGDCLCDTSWPLLDTLVHGIRQAHLPALVRGNPLGCVDKTLPTDTTQRQMLTTALAFMGSEASDSPLATPVTATPLSPAATPLDPFSPDTPEVWRSLVNKNGTGWLLYAVFNWSAAATVKQLPLPEGYSTVYDFWAKSYLGTATGTLDVEVPAGGVRVLCLRPYAEQPVLIGALHNIGCGSREIESLAWDAASQTYTGTCEAKRGEEMEYLILAPEGLKAQRATPSLGEARYSQKDRLVRLSVVAGENGPMQWQVSFAPAAK